MVWNLSSKATRSFCLCSNFVISIYSFSIKNSFDNDGAGLLFLNILYKIVYFSSKEQSTYNSVHSHKYYSINKSMNNP